MSIDEMMQIEDRSERAEALKVITTERRELSRDRVREIVKSQSAGLEFRYSNYTPDEMFSYLSKNNKGTIIVSCHTHAYYLLLGALDFSPKSVCCIVQDPMVEELRALGYPISTKANLQSTLSSKLLSNLIANKEHLFIMGDVLVAETSSRCIVLDNKVARYSVSWARLAAKFDLNVVCLFFKDCGNYAEIELDVVDTDSRKTDVIACNFFDKFDLFIKGQMETWEKQPHFERHAFPLPPVENKMTAELLAVLSYASQCDLKVAKAVQNLVKARKAS